MNRFKALLVVAITLSLFSFAKAGTNSVPKPKPAGDLDLVIVPTDSPDYLDQWLKTPSNQRVALSRIEVAKPGQLMVASFLVTGFSPDQKGNVAVSVSFAFLDPNGKALFNERRYAEVSGKAPVKPAFIVADPSLDIVLEDSDPEGVYTIIGIAEDQVSNKAVRRSYKMKFAKK